MQIPEGCTHIYPANELDYEPKPMFFRKQFVRWNRFDGRPMYELQFFTKGRWVVDTSFCDRFKKLRPIEVAA